MNILVAAFELTPLAKTGGLADVIQALSIEWKNLGHNPIVILPKHKLVDIDKYAFKKLDIKLNVPMGFSNEYAALWSGKLPSSDTEIILIEHDDYFMRDNIYGNGEDYFDNDRRFIFYCRAVLEAGAALGFKTDILHAHDHHAAFTLAFLKSYYKDDPHYKDCRSVYTIHNLSYQGKFNPYRAMDFSGFGMKEFYSGSWFEMHGVVNCMKVGIMFADKITTVSPNYAQEIRLPYYSEGLQDVLNHRGADLIGILNGVFYEKWSPSSDNKIYENYSSDNIEVKRNNKNVFLSEQGIDPSTVRDVPLIGMVSRLTEQKGIDIIKEKLDYYLSHSKIQFALLGSGQEEYVEYFQHLAYKYPKDVFVKIGYDEHHAHRIIASSDFIILPSRFEPCGLTQMYALKYGTIPIVRSTGGLKDTVSEYNPETKDGTGFVFNNYDKDDFSFAIERSLSIYNAGVHWDQIRQNAMKEDFSAKRQAQEYLKVFEWAKEK